MEHINCGEYVFLTNGTAVCEDCNHTLYLDDLDIVPDVPVFMLQEAC